MIDATLGYLLAGIALTIFAVVGFRTRGGVPDTDAFLVARDTQSPASLALSFFASALGVWILLAPPEIGSVNLGIAAVAGYAVGQAGAIWIYAYIGPRMRRVAPSERTILGFVKERFGQTFSAYVAVVSVLYMFVFLVAELTGIGKIFSTLTDASPQPIVVLIAAVTVAYTAWGGLPASLRTDRWQAVVVLTLIAVGGVAILLQHPRPSQNALDGGLGDISRPGIETFVILVIAVVAANLFHQGFWQRVWAARTDVELRRGANIAAAVIFPLMLLMGITGMISAGSDIPPDPSVAFFDLLGGMPQIILAIILLLAVALVTSTVDTLQNALTSIVAINLTPSRSLRLAQVITILLTIPAVAIAWGSPSVLRIFLIADLLAATIAVPVLMGLSRRVSARASISGAIAGIIAVLAVAVVIHGPSVVDMALALTMPNGPSLGFFIAAPLASTVVTLAMTDWSRSKTHAS